MKIYIAGEDAVTLAVTKKILTYCATEIQIISELPARGGQVRSKISEFNKLSETHPVVLLIDLDNDDCAPILIEKSIKNKNNDFLTSTVF